MAHTKSSKKRVVLGERNRLRNQAIKSRVKTYVKKVVTAVEKPKCRRSKSSIICSI